jgi:hypothetical protein
MRRRVQVKEAVPTVMVYEPRGRFGLAVVFEFL